MTKERGDTGRQQSSAFSKFQYLKDVFLCSLVAFGGPEAHLGVFLDRLVQKKNYLTEKALLEWMALCSFLPGPTSTQVITGIGLKKGGRSLALLTLLVWAMPMIVLMGALSFLSLILDSDGELPNWLAFLVPMAAGFVGWAAWQIGRKVVMNMLTFGLWAQGFAVILVAKSPWAIPLILVSGAILSVILGKTEFKYEDETRVNSKVPRGVFGLFLGLSLLSWLALQFSADSLVAGFERFYRFGYLVFGGGQVVVPVMQSELVDHAGLLTEEQFLSGFGLVQALPGPMFSFAAYVGGISETGHGNTRQVMGALVSGLAIFLPGTLLLFVVFPVWEKIRRLDWAFKALSGLNATAGGLVGGALVAILIALEAQILPFVYFGMTLILLATRRVPTPLIVVTLGIVSYFLSL